MTSEVAVSLVIGDYENEVRSGRVRLIGSAGRQPHCESGALIVRDFSVPPPLIQRELDAITFKAISFGFFP